MALLTVKDAAFSYRNKKGVEKHVFDGIDFSVERGEIFCIVGPNGCGKSTLIDCLLGLNKLEAGDILIADKSISEFKAKELASHIAYVPQNHKITFGYTVLDIITMGRTYEQRVFEPPTEEERDYARKCLSLVGLSGFETRDYSKLSGGELQLVLIARALCQKADVLIMDEPTAHLDFRHELNVMEIIAKLVKEQQISIIMATHFLNQAYYLENAGVNTRVALMSDCHFGMIGTPSEVLSEENLLKVFNIVTEVASTKDGERKYIIPLYNEK